MGRLGIRCISSDESIRATSSMTELRGILYGIEDYVPRSGTYRRPSTTIPTPFCTPFAALGHNFLPKRQIRAIGFHAPRNIIGSPLSPECFCIGLADVT